MAEQQQQHSQSPQTPVHAKASPSTPAQGQERKGPWSSEEDDRLRRAVTRWMPRPKWADIAGEVGERTAKQCRERWEQNLNPRINKSPITPEESIQIVTHVEQYGKKWADISRQLTCRSDNCIKNWYNGMVQKGKTRRPLSNEFAIQVRRHFEPEFQRYIDEMAKAKRPFRSGLPQLDRNHPHHYHPYAQRPTHHQYDHYRPSMPMASPQSPSVTQPIYSPTKPQVSHHGYPTWQHEPQPTGPRHPVRELPASQNLQPPAFPGAQTSYRTHSDPQNYAHAQAQNQGIVPPPPAYSNRPTLAPITVPGPHMQYSGSRSLVSPTSQLESPTNPNMPPLTHSGYTTPTQGSPQTPALLQGSNVHVRNNSQGSSTYAASYDGSATPYPQQSAAGGPSHLYPSATCSGEPGMPGYGRVMHQHLDGRQEKPKDPAEARNGEYVVEQRESLSLRDVLN